MYPWNYSIIRVFSNSEGSSSHDIDRYNYDKSPWHYKRWFLKQYREALLWLNILSMEPETVPREDCEERVLRQMTRLENVEAELESMKAALRKLSKADEKAEKLKKLRKQVFHVERKYRQRQM